MYIKTRDGKTSTLRALFQRMAPMGHHFDPQQSMVLAHIAEVLGCDLQEAQRCFNSMRQGKVGVIRFNRAQAVWHGCEWVPEDEEESKLETARRLGAIDKRITKLEAAQRRMPKGGSRKEDATEDLADTIKSIMDEINGLKSRMESLEKRVNQDAATAQAVSSLRSTQPAVEEDDYLTTLRRVVNGQAELSARAQVAAETASDPLPSSHPDSTPPREYPDWSGPEE